MRCRIFFILHSSFSILEGKKIMNEARIQQLKEMQDALGLEFKNLDLLNQSLTHTSYAYELSDRENGMLQNERMEFLGDVVLGLIVSEYIYKKYPDYMEGDLAKIRAKVVSRPILAKRAKYLELGKYLLLGKGEEMTGGRNRHSILADTMEALMGAIYLDSGLEKSRYFVLAQFEEEIEKITENVHVQDYKTDFQEFTQKKFRTLPFYKVINREGPDHNRIFEIAVMVKGKTWGVGKGGSKKEAQQQAAFFALQHDKEERELNLEMTSKEN
ncbi:MAG: ribonuclease III [Nitrospirota bacterium]